MKNNNKIYAYLRVSTKEQILKNQQIQIEKYANQNNLKIDQFIKE